MTDEVLRPEDSLETWSMIFLSGIGPGGDFRFLLNGYIRLVEQWIANDKLTGELQPQTNGFLYTFIPDAIDKVLNLPYLSLDDQSECMKFLKATSEMIPYAVVRENEELLKSTFNLLCTQKTFYIKNGSPYSATDGKISKCFQDVCRHVIEKNAIEIMTDRCLQNDPPATLRVFDGMLAVVWALLDGVEDCDFSLNRVEESLVVLFEKLSGLQRVDALMLQRITTFATLIVEHRCPMFVSELLATAEKLTKSEVLDQQLCGADILCKIGKSESAMVRESFDLWTKQTDLGEFVCSRSKNKALMKRLEDVLPRLMNFKLLSDFWRATELEHVSVRGIMYSIVSKALAFLPEQEAIEFIRSTSELESMNLEMLTFLANASVAFVALNTQVAQDLARTVVNFALKENIRNESGSAIDILIGNKALQPALFAELGLHLENCEEQAVVVGLLTKLVRECGEIRVKHIKKVIVRAISQEGANKDLLLTLLVAILVKTKQPLTLKFLQTLTESECGDSLWSMISQLFDQQGCNALDDDCLKHIEGILDSLVLREVSEAFLNFLLKFILVTNQKAGILTQSRRMPMITPSLPTGYQIESVPIRHFDVAMNALLRITNASKRKDWQKTIIGILTHAGYVPNTEIVQYLLSLLDKTLHEGSAQEKAWALDFLYEFVTRFEQGYVLSDFGLTRHSATEKGCDKQLKIFDFLTGLEFNIKTSLTAPAAAFKNRVAYLLKRSSSSFFLKCNGILLTGKSLSDDGVTNGATVTVQMNAELTRQMPYYVMPTVVLHNLKFQDFLIGLLQTEYDQLRQSVWRLLKWLPSSQSISANEHDFEKPDESDILYVYKLHIWLNQLRGAGDDEIERNIPLLADLLVSKRKGYEGIILLFADRFVPALTDIAHKIVPFLMSLLSNKKLSFLYQTQTLIKKMVSAAPERLSDVITENPSAFETFLCNMSSAEREIPLFVQPLKNKSQLMLLCMRHIKEKQEKMHTNIGRLFSAIADDVAKDENVGVVVGECLELLLTATGTLFKNLGNVLKAIFTANPTICKENSNIIAKLLPVLLEMDDKHASERAVGMDICVIVLNHAGLTAEVKQLLEPYVSIETDSYNYQSSNNQRAKNGYAGLRNLGATCYMNSILQQLYFTPPFRYLILSSHLTDPAQIAIQRLFAEMTLSKKKSCDTQPFCSIWKGWGGHVINPREQQDAFEFLQFFLDQYDTKFRSIFQGEILNTIEAIGSDFSSSNTERFYGLSVDVQGYKNLNDSLQVFLQSEMFTGDNQYRMDNGQLVDAKKFARVSKAPKVFVFQLKRFEYDHTTWERYKLNDNFEFPKTLNIREIMCDNSEDLWYDLFGVVLHAGTAQGGHYTSLINLNKKWMWFNDGEVSEVLEKSFASKTFGDKSKRNDFDSKECAYLLVYVQRGATFEIDGTDFPVEKQIQSVTYIDPQLKEEIERDSEAFVMKQVAFSPDIYEVVMATDDSLIILRYFINVYCHSSGLKGTGQIETKLLRAFESPDVAANAFAVIRERQHDLVDTLLRCGQKDILDTLAAVITSCISKVAIDISGQFVSYFLDAAIKTYKNWRQLPGFLLLLHNFALIGDEQRDYVINKGWKNAFFGLLDLIYEAKSSIMTKNIDLTYMFMILSHISDTLGPADVEILMKFSMQILQSSVQIRPFIVLVNKLSNNGYVDLADFTKNVMTKTEDVSEVLLSELLLETLSCPLSEEQSKRLADSVLSSKRQFSYSLGTTITEAMKQGNQGIRSFWLNHPQVTLFAMLTNSSRNMRTFGENLVMALFSDVEPSELLQSEQKYTTFGPENIYAQVYSGLNTKSSEEMSNLCQQMIAFLRTDILTRPADFCTHETRSVQSLSPGHFYLSSFFKSLLWFFSTLNYWSSDAFTALHDVFNAISELDFPVDHNLFMCAFLMSYFQPEYVKPLAVDIYKKAFRYVTDLPPFQIELAVKWVWPVIVVAGEDVMETVMRTDTFSKVLHAILLSDAALSAPMREGVVRCLANLIQKDPTMSTIVTDMLTVSSSVCRCLSDALPLFQAILPVIPLDSLTELVKSLFSSCFDMVNERLANTALIELLLDHHNEVPLIKVDVLSMDLNPAIRGLAFAQEVIGLGRLKRWMHFWAENVPGFREEVCERFERSFQSSSEQLSSSWAVGWVTFLVEGGSGEDLLVNAFKVISTGPRSARTKVYHYLATVIEGRDGINSFLKRWTGERFVDETIETKSSRKVFMAGLKLFDIDLSIALMFELSDRVTDLSSSRSREAVRKICVVFAARPDERETLMQFLPVSDKQSMIDADLVAEAEVIFGGRNDFDGVYTEQSDEEIIPVVEPVFDDFFEGREMVSFAG